MSMCEYVRFGVTLAVTALLVAVLPGAALRVEAQVRTEAVTFAKDVAPILQEKCEGCHRVGQMAPMPLVTYEDVRPWARAIKSKVVAREMPPWHIDKTVGIQSFVNDISLSDEQIATIASWVDAGAPRGDAADLPQPQQWPSGERWRLAGLLGRPPDHVIRSTPWTQPAEGQDQWWQPVVDSGLTEDRWIKAVEVRPTLPGRRIVHHGNARELVEYAVGKPGQIYAEDTGKLMKAGGTVRFDIHYHSVGEEITDFLSVGLWFYPPDQVPKYEVQHSLMGAGESQRTLDIPPGVVTKHEAHIPIQAPTKILSYQPHMHIRGKAMSLEAIYPDGRVEMLSHVDNFQFNWHVNYVYEDDVAPLLPPGTIVRVTAWHDNTATNRNNPDPTQWVGWGQRSYDDMYHAHVWYIELEQDEFDQLVEQR